MLASTLFCQQAGTSAQRFLCAHSASTARSARARRTQSQPARATHARRPLVQNDGFGRTVAPRLQHSTPSSRSAICATSSATRSNAATSLLPPHPAAAARRRGKRSERPAERVSAQGAGARPEPPGLLVPCGPGRLARLRAHPPAQRGRGGAIRAPPPRHALVAGAVRHAALAHSGLDPNPNLKPDPDQAGPLLRHRTGGLPCRRSQSAEAFIAEDEPVLTAAARQYPSLSRRPYLTRGQRREQLLSGGAAARPAAAAAGAAAVSVGGAAAAAAAVQPAAAAGGRQSRCRRRACGGHWRSNSRCRSCTPSCPPRGNGHAFAELAQLVSACALPLGAPRPRHQPAPRCREPPAPRATHRGAAAVRGTPAARGARRGGASGGEGDSGRGAGETDGGVSGADARRGARRGGAARGPAGRRICHHLAALAAPPPPSPPSPPCQRWVVPEPLECTARSARVRRAARRGAASTTRWWLPPTVGGRRRAEEEAQEAEVLLEAEVPAPPPLTRPPTLTHA